MGCIFTFRLHDYKWRRGSCTSEGTIPSVERNLILLTFNELKKYNDIVVTSHSLDISMRLHHTIQIFLWGYITHSIYFHDVTSQTTHFYRPGMKYAILSRILLSNSCGQPLVSGTCWVKHNKGPRAHSSESSNTDRLPDTAIWPYKLRRHITKAILQVLVV